MIVDGRRPIFWSVARYGSAYYDGLWHIRNKSDQVRVAVRLTHLHRELGFVFQHNAKAASTTIQRLLRRLLERAHAAGKIGSPILMSGPKYWNDILPSLEDGELFRFGFVREPVKRAVSTFNNFFVEEQNEYTRRHWLGRRQAGVKLGDASSANFDRFLDLSESIVRRSPDLCDLHVRTQKRNLLPDFLRFDLIGRMENYDSDLGAVLERIGLSEFLREGDLEIRENRSMSTARFREPNARQTARIARLYAEDYEAFGYPLPEA
jgi:hypothetical protein